MKYGQKLPKEVEKTLDGYISRVKKIKWFQPDNPDKKAINKQIKVALKAFGVDAKIEYRSLQTPDDWVAAWGAAWDAARVAAWGAAWDAARDAAWDAARGAACGAAWDAACGAACGAAWDAARDAARGAAWVAAWGAAWGAADLLAANTPEPQRADYLEKYPNGNFLQLIPLWEAGLYPVGVVDGKFICYVPVGGESLLGGKR